jgi:F0F1-type ATP synthase membrane subunit b/b'
MIRLDASIIWAIITFLLLIEALNPLLFKPLSNLFAGRTQTVRE